MIRRSRSLMRLASVFAAIAVVQAMAVQPALACERHDPAPAHASHNAASAANETDCSDQAPLPMQHEGDCRTNCLTMAGCSAFCFLPESPSAVSATHEAVRTAAVLQPHPSRFLTPDRPPPRV